MEIKIGDKLRRGKMEYQIEKILGNRITLYPEHGEVKTLISKSQLMHFTLIEEKNISKWMKLLKNGFRKS